MWIGFSEIFTKFQPDVNDNFVAVSYRNDDLAANPVIQVYSYDNDTTHFTLNSSTTMDYSSNDCDTLHICVSDYVRLKCIVVTVC